MSDFDKAIRAATSAPITSALPDFRKEQERDERGRFGSGDGGSDGEREEGSGRNLPSDAGERGEYMVNPNNPLPSKGDVVDYYGRDGEKTEGRVRSVSSNRITIGRDTMTIVPDPRFPAKK